MTSYKYKPMRGMVPIYHDDLVCIVCGSAAEARAADGEYTCKRCAGKYEETARRHIEIYTAYMDRLIGECIRMETGRRAA